ncbi:MAG: NAD(P)-binding domain-containing protein [Myxococcales bacterium]|nr:NAD(P)-binding domain-containing protein [Myxococcales bacterium]
MTSWVILGGIVLLVGLVYTLLSRLEHHKVERAAKEQADVAEMGEVVPASLYPVIDPGRCIQSGACIAGCPEKQVLGLVGGRAHLLNPMACIGHGLCEVACPVNAIKLVYGTKTRGVELPRLDANFQTSQPGIYIVGELSGMGLIRNAVKQGREAAAHILAGAKDRPPRRGVNGALDALVIGAGPAGISATLGLIEAKLRVLMVERELFGGTIMHYPRAKVVMTGALELPIYGRVGAKVMSKEELVAVWQDIYQKVKPPLVTEEVVESLSRSADDMWTVRTTKGEHRAANVVLALGMRGAPAKLGVPGEETAKVAYRLLEPEPFEGKHVLVVGGGNAAVESALALSDFGKCASVSISYRRDKFARCRAENRRRIDQAIDGQKVCFLANTSVTEVFDGGVTLKGDAGKRDFANDALIVQIGGTPPTAILKSFGIELVTKYAER